MKHHIVIEFTSFLLQNVTKIIWRTKCLNSDGYFSWDWRIISAIKSKWNTIMALNVLVFYCKMSQKQKQFDLHTTRLEVTGYFSWNCCIISSIKPKWDKWLWFDLLTRFVTKTIRRTKGWNCRQLIFWFNWKNC